MTAIVATQKHFTASRRRWRPSHRKAVSGIAITLCLTKPANTITRTGVTYPQSFDLAIRNPRKPKVMIAFAEELGLVQPSVGHIESADPRYRECRTNSGGHSTSTEPPHAQGDRRRD